MSGAAPVVVTAGGTRESIDPIRYLSNRSSGKMGFALARAASEAGHPVTLITTRFPHELPDGVDVVDVESAAEMEQAVLASLQPRSVLVMAAAVADYRPAHAETHKIKKKSETLTIELVRTPDILLKVASVPQRNELFVVGFAAETDDLVENANKKMLEKKLDLIVLNDVANPDIGMGSDDNAVSIFGVGGVVEEVARAPKIEVARRIIACIDRRWQP